MSPPLAGLPAFDKRGLLPERVCGRGFSIELNLRRAGGASFRANHPMVGIALSGNRHTEFRIGSDRTDRVAVRRGNVQVLPAGADCRIAWEAGDFAMVHLASKTVESVTHRAGVLTGSAAQVGLRDPLAQQLLFSLADHVVRRVDVETLFCESLVVALVARLAGLEGAPGRCTEGDVRALDAVGLRRVTEWIEDNLAGEVSVADMARVAGLGPHQFTRQFRRAVGVPPYQYVIGRRIARASALLESSDKTITEIAYESGFSSHSHLSSSFRRVTGRTPLELRQPRGGRTGRAR